MKGVTVERPIVVGTVAYWLGKKADDTKTHKWTAYIRGPNNEDLTYFIKRVVFKLHESFKNSKRAVEQPPFEIHETGWGEFELGIMIVFTDPNERPVELFHFLKLHPPEGHVAKTKKPVVSETFDVIVFNDPHEPFHKKLVENERSYSSALAEDPASDTPLAVGLHAGDQYSNYTEQTELRRVAAARARVQAEITRLQERFTLADDEVTSLSHEVATLQQCLYASSASANFHQPNHPLPNPISATNASMLP